MPEYVLKHNPNDQGLYTFYYHYFVQRWAAHDVADYDLDCDELIYRGTQGRADRRIPFGTETDSEALLFSDSLPS